VLRKHGVSGALSSGAASMRLTRRPAGHQPRRFARRSNVLGRGRIHRVHQTEARSWRTQPSRPRQMYEAREVIEVQSRTSSPRPRDRRRHRPAPGPAQLHRRRLADRHHRALSRRARPPRLVLDRAETLLTTRGTDLQNQVGRRISPAVSPDRARKPSPNTRRSSPHCSRDRTRRRAMTGHIRTRSAPSPRPRLRWSWRLPQRPRPRGQADMFLPLSIKTVML